MRRCRLAVLERLAADRLRLGAMLDHLFYHSFG